MNDRPAEELDDLMDRYLFGLLDETTESRVRRKVEADPEWRLAYEDAVRRKQALVQGVRAGAAEDVAACGPDAEEVLTAARKLETRARRTRRMVRGSLAGVAAAAVVAARGGACPKPRRVMHRGC